MKNKITDSIFSVGVLNPNVRIADVVVKTSNGTTYNSYVVKGSEKIALIETVHKDYFDKYLKNVEEISDINKIDYLVMNHNEPDHSGAIQKLVELNPKITILTSPAGAIYLKNITNNSNLNLKIVKNDEYIDLGNKTLRFILAPFLHWPDSMLTYVEEEKTLFTCDFLGCHYCEPYGFDFEITDKSAFLSSLKTYFDCIFSPFKKYVTSGISKIKNLDISFVCPSHGPVLTKDFMLDQVIKTYEKWSNPQKPKDPLIPIFYCSAYGNTKQIAKAISRGIQNQIPNSKVSLYNVVEFDTSDLCDKLNKSSAFLVGSPTINKDAAAPIWTLLATIDAINNAKKLVATFGSFGWSGEAASQIAGRLKSLKLSTFDENFRVCFTPTEKDLENATEFGEKFAKELLKNLN